MQVPFGVWSIIETSFSLFFRNLVLFVGIGLIFYAPILALPLVAQHLNQTTAVVLMFVLVGLLLLTVPTLYAGAVVYAVSCLLSERETGLRATIEKALRRALPLLGVSIVVGILVGLGTLLLFPGILAYTMCWVAVPAVVVEGLGVSGALERSCELTKGYRVRIFGIACILVVFGWLARWVAGIFVSSDSAVVTDLLDTLFQLLVGTIAGITSCVGYFALRAIKHEADEIPDGFLGRLWSSE